MATGNTGNNLARSPISVGDQTPDQSKYMEHMAQLHAGPSHALIRLLN